MQISDSSLAALTRSRYSERTEQGMRIYVDRTTPITTGEQQRGVQNEGREGRKEEEERVQNEGSGI
jgi:hypothetical protein